MITNGTTFVRLQRLRLPCVCAVHQSNSKATQCSIRLEGYQTRVSITGEVRATATQQRTYLGSSCAPFHLFWVGLPFETHTAKKSQVISSGSYDTQHNSAQINTPISFKLGLMDQHEMLRNDLYLRFVWFLRPPLLKGLN